MLSYAECVGIISLLLFVNSIIIMEHTALNGTTTNNIKDQEWKKKNGYIPWINTNNDLSWIGIPIIRISISTAMKEIESLRQ